MLTILKSLLDRDNEDYTKYIDFLLDPEKKEVVFNNEIEYLKYLSECFQNSGKTPTEELFLIKFPECKAGIEKASVLNKKDLYVYYSNLMTKRANNNASRALMEMAREVSEGGFSYEHLDKMRGFLHITDDEDIVDNTESADSYREYYNQMKKKPLGLQTGVKAIDSRIGGIAPGSTAVVGGFTSNGKSIWTNNMAYHNAKKLKYNLCIINLEVQKEEVLRNLLCRHSVDPKFTAYSGIPTQKVKDATLTPDEEEFLLGEVNDDYFSTGGMIKILDETDFKTFSFGEIREKLEAVDDEMTEKTGYGLDGVIWDHAQLFKFNGSGSKRSTTDEGNAYVSFIRKLGIAFRREPETKQMRKIANIICSQTSRDGFKRASKSKGRYDLRAFAEINELERAGHIIMTIYMDEDMKNGKEANVCLLKNRNGQTMYEPSSIYIEPEVYVAGEEMEGFSEVMNMDDIDSVFGDGSVSELF